MASGYADIFEVIASEASVQFLDVEMRFDAQGLGHHRSDGNDVLKIS